jgi:nitroreductase
MNDVKLVGAVARDAIALLRTRRSVSPPGLSGPGPTGAEIEAMLTIAMRVPDHGKLAPWRFIVFEGEARLRAGALIAQVFAADNPEAEASRLALEERRLAHAPLVIGVVSRAAPHVKIPEWEQQMSAGAACTLLVTAANALGYATAWLTEWYAYDRRVLARLGLADHERMAGFIHIGRALAKPEDRPRPALADKATYF